MPDTSRFLHTWTNGWILSFSQWWWVRSHHTEDKRHLHYPFSASSKVLGLETREKRWLPTHVLELVRPRMWKNFGPYVSWNFQLHRARPDYKSNRPSRKLKNLLQMRFIGWEGKMWGRMKEQASPSPTPSHPSEGCYHAPLYPLFAPYCHISMENSWIGFWHCVTNCGKHEFISIDKHCCLPRSWWAEKMSISYERRTCLVRWPTALCI